MAFRCAAGLNVAFADRDADWLSIPCSSAAAFYDRVEAVSPETVIFFPLPLNESQFLAFADYPLTRRIMLSGAVLPTPMDLSLLAGDDGWRKSRCLCGGIYSAHDRYKKRA